MAREGLPAVLLVRRPCFCIISGVDESFMADEEVASSESFGANVAYERLLFGVCSGGGVSASAEEMHSFEETGYLMCRCRCSSLANRRWQWGQGSVFVLVAEAFLLT